MGSQEGEKCPPPTDEDELTLPRSSLNKVIKQLAPSARVNLQSKKLILNCCMEFIHLISSEAAKQSNKSNTNTINPEHIFAALDQLGFSEYKSEAQKVLKDCNTNAAKSRRLSSRLENLGIPEEELFRKQQELFAQAREEQNRLEREQLLMLKQQMSAGTSGAVAPPAIPPKKEDDD